MWILNWNQNDFLSFMKQNSIFIEGKLKTRGDVLCGWRKGMEMSRRGGQGDEMASVRARCDDWLSSERIKSQYVKKEKNIEKGISWETEYPKCSE